MLKNIPAGIQLRSMKDPYDRLFSFAITGVFVMRLPSLKNARLVTIAVTLTCYLVDKLAMMIIWKLLTALPRSQPCPASSVVAALQLQT